ncbi:p037 [Rhizobium phage 16-3]|nr:p037 [Rhizobium phage 16-3]ABF71289.1 p037 [Rhizobium phage 16-3]
MMAVSIGLSAVAAVAIFASWKSSGEKAFGFGFLAFLAIIAAGGK